MLLVGYGDNMLTARHRQDVNANQELLALGVANLGTGLLRGFPVSSSGSRTALGDSAGGRTHVVFAMARVKQDLRTYLDAYGLTSAVGEDHIFPTLPTALAAYEQWTREQRR